MSMTNFNNNLLARGIEFIVFAALTLGSMALYFSGVIWWLPNVLFVIAAALWLRLNYKKDLRQVLANIANILLCFVIMLVYASIIMGLILSWGYSHGYPFTMSVYHVGIGFSVLFATVVTGIMGGSNLFVKPYDWPDFDL